MLIFPIRVVKGNLLKHMQVEVKTGHGQLRFLAQFGAISKFAQKKVIIKILEGTDLPL